MKVKELIDALEMMNAPNAEIGIELKCSCGGIIGYKAIATIVNDLRQIPNEYMKFKPTNFIYLQYYDK